MQPTPDQADRAVRAFVAALARLRQELPTAIPGARTAGDVVRMAVQREIPREATLSNGLEYAVHGVGCRFVTKDGLEVDVDVDHDGTEIFEAWRLFNFVNSDPTLGELSREDLTAAAQRLARSGELRQVRTGWYAAA